ncbi:MAG: YdbH domain-containing protein [Proteobacteria bacterium]|nr:YdbH domain-containing protein [Pseudomonadota bacterium]
MPRKIIEYLAASLAVLVALAVLGWFVLLPTALSTILPGLVNKAQDGVQLRSCTVRLVGLGGTSLYGILLSMPDVAELEVGQLDVTYSLAGLLKGQVREVRASDVLLEMLPIEKENTGQPATTNAAAAGGAPLALPPLDRLVVSSGQLFLPHGGVTHTIPFSLDYTTAPDRNGGEASLLAAPLGATLSVRATLDLSNPGDYAKTPGAKPSASQELIEPPPATGSELTDRPQPAVPESADSPEASESGPRVTVHAELQGLALQRLCTVLNIPLKDLTLQGQTSASATGSYSLDAGTFRLGQCDLAIADPVLMSLGQVLVSGQGIRASLRQEATGGFPFEVELQALHGFGGTAALRATGRAEGGDAPTLEADYTLEQSAESLPLKARFNGTAKAGLTPDGWTASTTGDIAGTLRLGEEILAMDKATYTLDSRGQGSEGALDWALRLAPQQLHKAGSTLSTGALQASGTLSGALSTAIAGTMQVTLPALRLVRNGFQAKADLSLHGTVRALPEPGASVTLQGRNISVNANDTHLSKASFSLPLVYPPARGHRGNLTIADINAAGRQWGRLELGLRQDERQLLLDGTYLGAPLPGLQAAISARLTPGAESLLEAQVVVDGYTLPAGFELARLNPALTKITAAGTISVRADLRYESTGLVATANVQLADGSLVDAGRDARMDGITLSLDLPDLLSLRSAPLQRATFSNLHYKDIAISDGQLLFQLDGPQRLLTTGARFNWLGGVVQALPFQVVSGRSDYDLILYCSNLGITELLSQLGFAQASGKGQISGKIPVRVQNGQISFDAAQLQSSPESGGVIQIQQAEALLAGLEPGSAQYVQMKIASEALKNFEYKWAKVTASSEGETLKVQLQLDGQPAQNLPFEYSQDYGLIELQAAGQGLKFQGIRLDVNFSLPLDRMLRLRELFGQEQ